MLLAFADPKSSGFRRRQVKVSGVRTIALEIGGSSVLLTSSPGGKEERYHSARHLAMIPFQVGPSAQTEGGTLRVVPGTTWVLTEHLSTASPPAPESLKQLFSC